MGQIVGLNPEDEVVYMPAYNYNADPSLNLYEVSLNTGKGKIHEWGNKDTVEWFVGERGKILAKEDYIKDRQIHIISSKLTGEWVTVYRI